MITYVPLPQIWTVACPKAQTENTSFTLTKKAIQGKRFLQLHRLILKAIGQPISKFNFAGKVTENIIKNQELKFQCPIATDTPQNNESDSESTKSYSIC